MASLIGGDIQQMSALQTKFTNNASQLDSISSLLKSRIGNVPWAGPDADQFKGQDLSQIVSNISGACTVLRKGASDLGKNVNDQQGASQV